MKNYIYIILLLSFFNTACSKNPSSANRIRGEWVVTDAEGAFKELAIGTHYFFDDANMYTQPYGTNDKISHPYRVQGDTIFENINGKDIRIPFSFEGEKLIFNFLNSEDQYTLERKSK